MISFTKRICDCTDGILKQWYVNYEDNSISKLFEKKYQTNGIYSLLITYDNKYLFIGSNIGYLLQFNIEQKRIVKNYKGIFCFMLVSLVNT